jgi:glycosyltransferase involved in cell wall biosynthesis
MPVCNGERFIRLALNSLLAQTHRDFELIISDNVSDDATPEICRTYAAGDSRVRYTRLAVQVDAITNFDHVLRLAGGEYFMWAAADDLWEPSFVSTLLGLLQGAPEAVLAFSVFDTIDERGETIRVYPSALELPSPDPLVRLRAFLLQEETRGKPNLIYGLMRRRAIHDAGGFRVWGAGPWGADMLVVFKLLGSGNLTLSETLLFHKRLLGARATVSPRPEGHTVSRHLKGMRGWYDLFTGYARVIASDNRLPALSKIRLQGALAQRIARVGVTEIGRHLRPSSLW